MLILTKVATFCRGLSAIAAATKPPEKEPLPVVINAAFSANLSNACVVSAPNAAFNLEAEPFDPFMGKVFPKLGEEELGALIQFQREKSKSALERGVETALEALKSAVKTESDELGTRVGTPGVAENVGPELSGAVNKAFQEFKNATTLLYNEADQLLGNKAVIPTSSIKREALEILNGIPKTAEGKYVGGVSEITLQMLQDIANLPANINATHMSAFRTMFGEAGFSEEMLKGFGQKTI